MDATTIRKAVRESYGNIARKAGTIGCGCSCNNAGDNACDASKALGYSDEQMNTVPDGANLGLGCGNPTALASLKPGETVLDLGSGAGFDCFLAARQVGETGHVIGVDMTPDMLEKARENATKSEWNNVEFRLGEIENLPVANDTVDAIISNCVINLAPNKQPVFSEAYRVLKPGGRIMISDIVLKKPLPEPLAKSIAALVGCVAGAIKLDDYLDIIRESGFTSVDVVEEKKDQTRAWAESYITDDVLNEMGLSMDEALKIADNVVSVSIHAVK